MLESLVLGVVIATAPAAVTTTDIESYQSPTPPKETVDDRLCRSDIDKNGFVDWYDMLHILSAWGDCARIGPMPADIDRDGCVGMGDLLCVFCDWGPCQG